MYALIIMQTADSRHIFLYKQDLFIQDDYTRRKATRCFPGQHRTVCTVGCRPWESLEAAREHNLPTDHHATHREQATVRRATAPGQARKPLPHLVCVELCMVVFN